MNRPAVFLTLFFLFGSRLAHGQGSHSVSLDVQPVSGGAAVQNTVTTKQAPATSTFSTSNVNVTRATETLQINVRNFGPVPTAAKIDWYFIAAPVQPSPDKPAEDQEYVFDQGSKDLTLAGGGTQTITAESKEVTATRKVASGRSRRASATTSAKKPSETGSNLHGWLARVVVDGKTVAARGSTQTYEDIASDDASLQELLAGAPPKEARSRKSSKTATTR